MRLRISVRPGLMSDVRNSEKATEHQVLHEHIVLRRPGFLEIHIYTATTPASPPSHSRLRGAMWRYITGCWKSKPSEASSHQHSRRLFGRTTRVHGSHGLCGLRSAYHQPDFSIDVSQPGMMGYYTPSPFFDLLGSESIGKECLVGPVERPNCLPVISPSLPFCGSLAVAGCEGISAPRSRQMVRWYNIPIPSPGRPEGSLRTPCPVRVPGLSRASSSSCALWKTSRPRLRVGESLGSRLPGPWYIPCLVWLAPLPRTSCLPQRIRPLCPRPWELHLGFPRWPLLASPRHRSLLQPPLRALRVNHVRHGRRGDRRELTCRATSTSRME
jgi:hypothetical protein